MACLYVAMVCGYLDDRSEKPWGQLKKGLLDAAVCLGVAYFVWSALDGEVWLIVCSFCRERIPFILPKQFMGMEAKLVLTNYPALRQQGKTYTLPKPGFRIFPYEAAVLRMS